MVRTKIRSELLADSLFVQPVTIDNFDQRRSRRALDTLDEGLADIAQFNPDAAHRLRISIQDGLEHVRTFPRSARMVPEEADPDVREVLREPFRIMYEIHARELRLLVVRRMERSALEAGELTGEQDG
jgi:plasmid stabilization system protein ParE